MRHVGELKGSGAGRRALIVGAGPSVRRLPEIAVPADVEVFLVNREHEWSRGLRISWVTYADQAMREWLLDGTVKVPEGARTLAWKKVAVEGTTDFFFDEGDVLWSHSGFHALQIADQIMGFARTYLIGMDCRAGQDGKIHAYGDDEYKGRDLKMLRNAQARWLQAYDRVEWKGEIANLGEESGLRPKFGYWRDFETMAERGVPNKGQFARVRIMAKEPIPGLYLRRGGRYIQMEKYAVRELSLPDLAILASKLGPRFETAVEVVSEPQIML